MESHSIGGQIQCSQTSATLLREQDPEIIIVARGKIQVKGKGTMYTFWVAAPNENDNARRDDDNDGVGAAAGCTLLQTPPSTDDAKKVLPPPVIVEPFTRVGSEYDTSLTSEVDDEDVAALASSKDIVDKDVDDILESLESKEN